MLCSNCSQSIRPLAAFDIDGTLGNYHWHFAQFAFEYWDIHWSYRPDGMWDGSGEFEDYLGLTKEQYRQAKLAYRQGGMKRTMPKFDGVDTLFQSLPESLEVWVATSRPWQRLDNIDPDTREWLRRNNIHIDGMLYGDDKYQQLVEAVDQQRIVGVVDDLPEQLMKARALGLPVFMVDRHHNVHYQGEEWQHGTLPQVAAWLLDNIQEWNDGN